MMDRSEHIAELAAALSKFSGVVKPPSKTSFNPATRSKYAGVAEVKAVVRAALAECGLAIVQSPVIDGTQFGVETLLAHASGQWISSVTLVPITRAKTQQQISLAEATTQEIGSAMTYASRYALLAMLCLAGEDEEDDDGHAASGRPSEQQQRQDRPAQQQAPQDFSASHKSGPEVDGLVAALAMAATASDFGQIAGALLAKHGPWAATQQWRSFKDAVNARSLSMQSVWDAQKGSAK